MPYYEGEIAPILVEADKREEAIEKIRRIIFDKIPMLSVEEVRLF